MLRKKTLLVLSFMLCMALCVRAQNREHKFDRAVSLYEFGHYAEAHPWSKL